MKTSITKLLGKLTILAGFVALLDGNQAQAVTWTNYGAGSWNWTDTLNWSNGIAPQNPETTEVVIPSAYSIPLSTLLINLNTGGDQVLKGGLTFQFATNWRWNPKLDMQGNKLILDGGSLRVAANSTTSGNIVTFANGTLQLGTETNSASVELGALFAGGAGVTNLTLAFESGAVFDTKKTSTILIAANNLNSAQQLTLDLSQATLHSGAANHTLALEGSLGVGQFENTASSNARDKNGLLKLGNLSSLSVGQDLILGQNRKINGSAAKAIGELQFLATNSGPVDFHVERDFRLGVGDDSEGRISNAPAVMNLSIGSKDTAPELRGVIYAGYNDKNQAGGNDSSAIGTLNAQEGTVSAWVKELRIGENISAGGSAIGTLNLSGLELNTLNIGEDAVIGKGANAIGTLSLKGGEANSVNLTVGDATGLTDSVLTLNDTHWTVGGKLLIGSLGEINVTVAGQPSGIDLVSDNYLNFVINTNGVIIVNFESEADSQVLWGLRMAGDQKNLFDGYVADGLLVGGGTYGNAAEVLYDGNYTYFAIPEPKGSFLFFMGIFVLLFLRFRTLRTRS